MFNLDLGILYFLNVTLSSPWLDSAMIYLTNLQHWLPVYILAFAFLIVKYKWRGVRMVIACLLLVGVADFVTNNFIKGLVGRPRPCSLINDPSGLYSWIRTPDGARLGFSFFYFTVPEKQKIVMALCTGNNCFINSPISRLALSFGYSRRDDDRRINGLGFLHSL